MSTTHTLTLSGCAPVPLAHYLKALGILRLVSEQKDPKATGRWHRDQFVLTSILHREALLKFFLEEYQPTPIVVPWSGGDYFSVNQKSPAASFDKTPTASRVVEAILSTTTARLAEYRHAITKVFEAMQNARVLKKQDIEGSGGPQRKTKADLLKALRGVVPDATVAWIDAAAIVENKSVTFNTLLGGGGGSDGNSHFSDNFMQCIWVALSDFANQRKNPVSALGRKIEFHSEAALTEAVFNVPAVGTKIRDLSPVLFDSTRVGGVNQGTGFEGMTASNPWDFILMIEGSVMFAGAIGRKLNDANEPSARFPFLFTATSSGIGASYLGESSGREIWLPVWLSACPLAELQTMIAEGRIERFGKPAKHGLDAFIGAAQLGFDRGIAEFQRVGFFKGRVGGDNYFTAVDRGRIKPARNKTVDLLESCHGWIDQFRRAAASENAPTSARRALTVLESAIVDLCVSNRSDHILRVFIALGRCEAAAARSFKWVKKETNLQPLQGLRKEWLKHCPQSIELRLAASLASLNGQFGNLRLPFRCHIEPVESKPFGFTWADNPTNNVQWSTSALPDVLNDIQSRRLIRNEDTDKRFESWASLADIKAFIEGQTDDTLLSALLWSTILINWQEEDNQRGQILEPVPPTLYALLKLCFPPVQTAQPEGILPVPTVPAIHRHASQGNGGQAAMMAVRRLRASGYQPVLSSLPVKGDYVRRTAAAMLFPISDRTLTIIHKQTTRPEPKSATA